MTPPMLRRLLILSACLATAPTVLAQAPRAMDRKDGPADPKLEVKYRNKWAVVVGINYDPEARKALNRGKIDRLDKAESDAREFAGMLLKYYGYRKEEVILLTGKDATKEAIEGYLQNGFLCDPGRVGPDDSVLFYFSGHGFLRRDRGVGYLIPFDARKTEAGDPDFATAIDTSTDLVRNLRLNCPARHKLLILDCCHSGSVFRLDEGTGGGRSPDEAIGPDLFRAAAFQGITASREGQLASDGAALADHSPFTKALLHALASIPQKQIAGRSSFTVSELFHEMQMMLHGALPDDQSPQSWWLDGGRGEFHFSPDPDAEYPRDELTEGEQKVFLAMVPTTFGNWWADEFPWFMPSLRYEILDQLPKSKSSDTCPDIRELRKVAERLARDATVRDHRHEHLKLLLATEGVVGRAKAFDQIIGELKERVVDEQSPSRPLDLHYLAVLLQKRGKAYESRLRYEEALKAYEAMGKGREKLRALQALCQVDYGVLCLGVLFEFDDAVESFRKAQRAVEETQAPPGPFLVYALCREADAHRRLARFRLSDQCMYRARALTAKLDPAQALPLSSSTWKQDAWAFMEQCKFKEAAASFEQSRMVLEKLLANGTNRYQCLIDLFHVKHGQALIGRFQGQDERSLALFRELTPEISEAIRALDNSQETISNFAELRHLLCERYVNSLERQADCGLFGQVPDHAEAADDYRRALRACVYFPEDRRDTARLDILYRRAAALGLPSGARDPKLAESLCREAGQIERRLREVQKVDLADLPIKVQIVRAIALTLARAGEGDGHGKEPAVDSPDDLRAVVRRFQDSATPRGPSEPDLMRINRSRLVDRDELERLMFAYKLLLTNRDRWELDRFEATACCDELFMLCRRATRAGRLVGGVDRDFLAYLRPYYDEAFRTKAALTPTPVKELMEIAWEATRGVPYVKPQEVNPSLVLYRASGQSYLLLDVPSTRAAPGGVCKAFPLREELNDEKVIREAYLSERLLPLPAEIRQVLASFHPSQRLTIRWRDPVSGIGGLATPPSARASTVLEPSEGHKPHFPFDLKAVMNGRPYLDQDDGDPSATRPPAGFQTADSRGVGNPADSPRIDEAQRSTGHRP